ncbi:methionine ABC transporter substrate-binding lipoprotein MetQ [Actinobacillus equuli]|uniref:methionine ABC transporter substrate-binding lipoprotein MetQ n=1 Tax=Actinobacillus equuli TaxID=718 RepID=UPI0024434631|nr:methionine ABC transporter substrate-binding lipoprotein MetQ [Actinobacillus equuli]WGE59564.1 methionine ABC transporter substrate-binding lipoprotein MetQ [Actinobacillus equuli subsp. haemolyticus]WGE61796.1 methionine ABC transporter substrate-binding lipoprotein MetQ [Actinobacillus equuli subsp. haemolyticus]
MKLKNVLSAVAICSVFLTACNEKQEKLKVGVISGPEHQVMEVAVKVAKEKYQREVELVVFTDYATPNEALNKGDLDLNAFQHQPYLDNQIKEKGYKLVSVGNSFVYPIAAYSKKIKSLNVLKDGETIAVPSDPTNLARALILLEKQGLIKLKPETGLKATSVDIIENPRQLVIKEIEAPLLPRTLDDVAFSVINTTYAGQIGLTPTKDGLFVEDKDSPYVNIIVAREDNKDSAAVQDFVKAYQTDEVFNKANEVFKGAMVKGW